MTTDYHIKYITVTYFEAFSIEMYYLYVDILTFLCLILLNKVIIIFSVYDVIEYILVAGSNIGE